MSGIAQFHRTIGGTSFIYAELTGVGNYALGGNFRELTNPTMWYYNGSTYAVAYEPNTTNNKVWISKQTGFTVESYAVNNGTSSPEPLDHPTPLLYINEATGYIYVIQNQFHVDAFDVWKSDSPEDISSFTQVTGAFDANGSYLALISYSGTNCVFATRSGSSPNGYDYSVIEVDLDNPNGYTDQLVVEMDFATNDVRAYLAPCNYYGTNTKKCYGLYSRNESNTTYYKLSLLFSDDRDNFDNLANTVSTDVTSAAITYSSLNTNYAIIGDDSDKNTSIAPIGHMLQLDDDVYVAYKSASDTMTINKYSYGSSGVQSTIDLPYTFTISDSGDGYVYMYYNGTYIIGTAKVDDSTVKLFKIQTDLTNFQTIRDIDTPDGAYLGLPENFDSVDGLYMMIGRSLIGFAGDVPYIITNDKFL